MGIVLNEKELALEALRNCDLGSNGFDTIGYLAKYYKSEGYRKKEIKDIIETFITKCISPNDAIKWGSAIDIQVNRAEKYKMVEIDYIPVTKNEMTLCESLQGKQAQRLLFALICVAKFSNAVNEKNNNWVNRQDKEIFRIANVVTPIRRQAIMLCDLRDAGFIRFSKKVDNININVLCLDKDDSDVVLKISDFRNLGYQYMRYHGEPYFECGSCGIVVKKGSNVQKYCHECAVDMNRQNNRENYRNMVRAQ